MRSVYKQKGMISKSCLLFMLFAILVISVGCKKFLDKKPNVSDIIPNNLDDLQTLLNNSQAIMNSRGTGGYAELVADNYYVLSNVWQQVAASPALLNQSESQNYIWGNVPHENYWVLPYTGPIYYSNIVLDHLPLIRQNPGDEEKYNTLKGSALFYRAFAFEGLAQLFCKPYSTENANSPGIILRLTSNVSAKTFRATVQETYDRIIADLNEAIPLLPDITTIPLSLRTQPSKTAAYALLARTYLAMRDYPTASSNANKALQQYSTLMNYDSLFNPVTNGAKFSPPISRFGSEVIFHNYSPIFGLLTTAVHRIDSFLYQSYDSSDLRKVVFFRKNTGANTGTYSFQGSYNGTSNISSVFDGLATDELYLIRAECAAHAGNKDAALIDLNALMINRWKTSVPWVPFTATDASDALNKILVERRKELVYRGLRWSDVRRLNLEGANISIKRNIAGTFHTLTPNDPRSVMLIALAETLNNPNIQQNPR